ncbi:hypothetical protein E3P99_02366 [Wallemia hederae]|uniref:Tyrosine specific protein phosphatases domain-containing protein n=1 Tax=Wallemia hederae TaxID=1540922 RepID=A0A4T0FKT9_9BASI|nr:hypothetical protein E3P99_02366 [Wallemia hederae]
MNADFLKEASLHEESVYKRSKGDPNIYKPLSVDYTGYYHLLLSDSEAFDNELRAQNQLYIVNKDSCSKDASDIGSAFNSATRTQHTKTSISHPLKYVKWRRLRVHHSLTYPPHSISIIVPLDCLDYMSSKVDVSSNNQIVLNNSVNLNYLADLCHKFHHDHCTISDEDYAYYQNLYAFNQSVDGDSHHHRLGNLLMSSAPGKKVRLRPDDDTQSRCPVDRDISLDFLRIKETGCQLLACCLDDQELKLLGTSWQEYSQSASDVGLSILRFPMPEGLHPPNLSDFYDRIGIILHQYTFKGVDVLAHCRGGVGRASLIACAWILRMGLVPDTLTPSSQLGVDEYTHVLHLLRSVISIVRRRRSIKAIETYEQVAFLYDFIILLRQKAQVA